MLHYKYMLAPVLLLAGATFTASAEQWHIVELGAGNHSIARGINARGEVVGDHSASWVGGFVRLRDGTIINVGPTGVRSSLRAINNLGQAVGASDPPLPLLYIAMLWTRGEGSFSLGTLQPNDTLSDANAINNRGQVVGHSCCALGEQHAFLWSAERGMIDLGQLGGIGNEWEGSEAYGINEHGAVVGESSTSYSVQRHAFLWTERDGMVDLGTLGGSFSTAFGINNRNEVVGISEIANGSMHAFLWTAPTGMMDLGTLGGDYSDAQAINDRGEIVGSSWLPSQLGHAFIWTARDGMVDLGTLPGSNDSAALAINNRGEVVGRSLAASGMHAAVMWTRKRR
jgi:probable HAF family extracellular repeat protein